MDTEFLSRLAELYSQLDGEANLKIKTAIIRLHIKVSISFIFGTYNWHSRLDVMGCN